MSVGAGRLSGLRSIPPRRLPVPARPGLRDSWESCPSWPLPAWGVCEVPLRAGYRLVGRVRSGTPLPSPIPLAISMAPSWRPPIPLAIIMAPSWRPPGEPVIEGYSADLVELQGDHG